MTLEMVERKKAYLLTFLQAVRHAKDLRVLEASQVDDVTPQQVRDDLAPLGFVQLVRRLLLEQEHGRLLSSESRPMLTS